ncbi:MAG: hypothetical protein ACRDGA_01850 [Bacteroidota bacterium]
MDEQEQNNEQWVAPLATAVSLVVVQYLESGIVDIPNAHDAVQQVANDLQVMRTLDAVEKFYGQGSNDDEAQRETESGEA